MAARQPRKTLTALAGLALGGCQLPAVNLATNQPIKVDIAMRLDVYQHGATGESASPLATPAPGKPAALEPGKRRKDREADLQVFKNSRYVGEGHDGLLAVVAAPDGEKGDEVRHAVAAENGDRMTEMKAYAKSQKLSLAEVQIGQGELWRNRSFKGELIEIRQPDGSYRWEPKKG